MNRITKVSLQNIYYVDKIDIYFFSFRKKMFRSLGYLLAERCQKPLHDTIWFIPYRPSSQNAFCTFHLDKMQKRLYVSIRSVCFFCNTIINEMISFDCYFAPGGTYNHSLAAAVRRVVGCGSGT